MEVNVMVDLALRMILSKGKHLFALASCMIFSSLPMATQGENADSSEHEARKNDKIIKDQPMAFVFPVRQTGATQDQADALTRILDLEQQIKLSDGSLLFVDSQNYLNIPTESTQPGDLPPDEGQMQTTAERFKFEDPFFTDPRPFPKGKARKFAQRAFKEAGDLLPPGTTPRATNNLFEFVPVAEPQSKQVAPAIQVPIDTHVNFKFNLADKPLVGPGAQASMTFDRNGNLTRLHHAVRFVGKGARVPILSPKQAQAVCTQRLAEQTPTHQSIEVHLPQLVYFAPPLSLQSVELIFPHYQCDGTIPDDREGRALLRSTLIPAILEGAPQPSLDVSVEGCTVNAAVSVTGTSPFSFAWSSFSTPLIPEQATGGSTVSYQISPKPEQGQVSSETVSLVVTDANGLTGLASQTIQLPSPCPLQVVEKATPTHRSSGVVDVGIEWIGTSQGLPGSAGSAANYVSRFNAAGIPIQFNWGDFNAWERDYKDIGQTTTGLDHIYVDNADLVFYTGHADGDGFTFPGNNDDGFLHFNDNPKWGNNVDAEWIVIAACGPLQDKSSGLRWWQRWGPAFQRLHIFAGYENVSYDQTVEGDAFPKWLLGFSVGFITIPPQPVRVAWALMAQEAQPSGVTWGVMGVTGTGGVTSWNDFFWNKGPVSPDIPAANITGFWKVSGDS
jgi:hypothetical protein